MRKLKIYCENDNFSELERAFKGEIKGDDVACEIVVCDEQEIRKLNADTRQIDAVTDVLSYPTLDGIRGKKLKRKQFSNDVDEEGNLFLGSIVICQKRAEEQAEEFGHSLRREMLYLATHGVFHLLGYDHMTESDKAEMREREETVLKKINAERN